jgi:glutathione synthase/RimK-type ligase-like ATP-grasp enzyme
LNSIGFLTIKRNQELSYFTEIALLAPKTVDVVRFTPLDIDPATELVHGFKFNRENKKWENSLFNIPAFIYDRCFYNQDTLSKKSEPIVNWLKQRPGTTFLGFGLPNKWEVYQALTTESVISPYLPKTTLITNFLQLKRLLTKEKSIILKPVSGSQGNGVVHIKVNKSDITFQTQRKGEDFYKSFTSLKDFKTFIEKLLQGSAYLGQRYLTMQMRDTPFDIRILLQKDKDGTWVEQGRGVRIGKEKGIVSNLHNGGSVISFLEFVNKLKQATPLLVEEIETITKHTPILLEQKFGRLFELGLDIGVTEDGAVWLIDINSKPGRKVITTTTPEKIQTLYQSPVNYMNYLDHIKSTI